MCVEEDATVMRRVCSAGELRYAGALVPASSLAMIVQRSAVQCFAGRRAGFSMARTIPSPIQGTSVKKEESLLWNRHTE